MEKEKTRNPIVLTEREKEVATCLEKGMAHSVIKKEYAEKWKVDERTIARDIEKIERTIRYAQSEN
jgi:DNA-binding NarL/FixJ family response regulator